MDEGRRTKDRGPLIVLSGPSGVGKTSVVVHLIANTCLPLRRAVTATTRPPRGGERPGVDYHFWTVDEFRAALVRGDMLEHAIVFGKDYYGTPRSEVDPHRAVGIGVILVIDVQGAEQIRKQYPADHLSVFLAPPSEEELRQRLEARRTEDPEKIARRLDTARAELNRAGEFDRRITNGELCAAAKELETVIRDQFTATIRGKQCSTS